MRDEKGFDFKVLCVAVGDPHQAHVEQLDQVRPHRLVEIEHFFETYKLLEAKDTEVARLARRGPGPRSPRSRPQDLSQGAQESVSQPGRDARRPTAADGPAAREAADRMIGRRVFVAVPLPEPAFRAVVGLVEGVRAAADPAVRDVRWVRLDGLHLTLRFIGLSDEDEIAAFGEAMDRAAATIAPFEVAIEGAGAFPAVGRPRVLWLDVTNGRDAPDRGSGRPRRRARGRRPRTQRPALPCPPDRRPGRRDPGRARRRAAARRGWRRPPDHVHGHGDRPVRDDRPAAARRATSHSGERSSARPTPCATKRPRQGLGDTIRAVRGPRGTPSGPVGRSLDRDVTTSPACPPRRRPRCPESRSRLFRLRRRDRRPAPTRPGHRRRLRGAVTAADRRPDQRARRAPRRPRARRPSAGPSQPLTSPLPSPQATPTVEPGSIPVPTGEVIVAERPSQPPSDGGSTPGASNPAATPRPTAKPKPTPTPTPASNPTPKPSQTAHPTPKPSPTAKPPKPTPPPPPPDAKSGPSAVPAGRRRAAWSQQGPDRRPAVRQGQGQRRRQGQGRLERRRDHRPAARPVGRAGRRSQPGGPLIASPAVRAVGSAPGLARTHSRARRPAHV